MEILKKFWNKINTAEYNEYLKNYDLKKDSRDYNSGFNSAKEEEKAEKFYKLARKIAVDCNDALEMGMAMDYYGKAAKLGHIPAQYECAQLIIIMAENSLLDEDPTIMETAQKYLENAALAGIEDARTEGSIMGDFSQDDYNNNQNVYYNQNRYNDDYRYGNQAPDQYGVASMVLGILGLVLCGICSIIALVYAGKQNAILPNGFSNAGKIMGIIGTVLWSIGIVVFIIGRCSYY